MNVRMHLIDYIQTHNLDIYKISVDTGIAEDKLRQGINEEINATELCTLCHYLDILPESFYDKKINLL